MPRSDDRSRTLQFLTVLCPRALLKAQPRAKEYQTAVATKMVRVSTLTLPIPQLMSASPMRSQHDLVKFEPELKPAPEFDGDKISPTGLLAIASRKIAPVRPSKLYRFALMLRPLFISAVLKHFARHDVWHEVRWFLACVGFAPVDALTKHQEFHVRSVHFDIICNVCIRLNKGP